MINLSLHFRDVDPDSRVQSAYRKSPISNPSFLCISVAFFSR